MGVIDRVIVGIGIFAVLVLAAWLVGTWVRKVGASMGDYCNGCGSDVGPTAVAREGRRYCSVACAPGAYRAPRKTA